MDILNQSETESKEVINEEITNTLWYKENTH